MFEMEGLRALWVGLVYDLEGEEGGETVLSYSVGVDIDADFVWVAMMCEAEQS